LSNPDQDWLLAYSTSVLSLYLDESYARAAEDIEVLTGINVPHSTQHRLVHGQTFEEAQVSQTVAEMS
jgi:hypothetical protein